MNNKLEKKEGGAHENQKMPTDEIVQLAVSFLAKLKGKDQARAKNMSLNYARNCQWSNKLQYHTQKKPFGKIFFILSKFLRALFCLLFCFLNCFVDCSFTSDRMFFPPSLKNEDWFISMIELISTSFSNFMNYFLLEDFFSVLFSSISSVTYFIILVSSMAFSCESLFPNLFLFVFTALIFSYLFLFWIKLR